MEGVSWSHINFSLFLLLPFIIGFLHLVAGDFFRSPFIIVRGF